MLPYLISPVCPECEKGYLSHREYLEDQVSYTYRGEVRLTYHTNRDFCSNPFCNYDHKVRNVHYG